MFVTAEFRGSVSAAGHIAQLHMYLGLGDHQMFHISIAIYIHIIIPI